MKFGRLNDYFPIVLTYLENYFKMSKPNSPPALRWALVCALILIFPSCLIILACTTANNYKQDGREVDLLHYVFARPDIKELQGNPHKVLEAIDDYHAKFNKLMNVGLPKGNFISNIIAERKPSVMIELGGYVGYSSILFGDAIRKNGGKLFLSIEKNPEMAAVSSLLVNLAGLRDLVRIVVGSSGEVLKELIAKKEISIVELIFMDHWQNLYLPDLWLLEGLGALVPGKSMLLADNVIMPGAPKYLEWVQSSPQRKKEIIARSDVGPLTPNAGLVYETTVPEFDTAFGKVCRVSPEMTKSVTYSLFSRMGLQLPTSRAWKSKMFRLSTH